MNNPQAEALYARIMHLANGPLTDQKISLYASCDPGFAGRLPPLSKEDRKAVIAQIKQPFLANPDATDRVLCNMAVHSWAREAGIKALPQIRADLYNEYWNGDPETKGVPVKAQTRSDPAPRTGLGTRIKGALGRFLFGPHDEEQ
ncbi:MAG: hypothetical protein EHM35_00865 [Planctomycetaceae bacterium]|nr:MAG: hypothetical protein EHM35_00865 [Planctomycetaceae bacterium]